jgi:Tfp pilus assembly protein PilV
MSARMQTQYRRKQRRLPPRAGAARSGLTLLEVLVTGLLLGVVISTAVPLLGWLAAEHRAAERQQWALQELNNLLERLTQQSYSKVTAEAAAAERLSAEGAQRLPEGELKVAVDDLETVPPSKRIHAELRWRLSSGDMTAPVRLTAWIYEQGRSE